jgi:predicted GNAT superfamily acetyltransferase
VDLALCSTKPFERAAPQARVLVPRDIVEVRQRDPQRAGEIQASLGEQFEEHFRAGLAVVGFERGDEAGTYLLGQWELK